MSKPRAPMVLSTVVAAAALVGLTFLPAALGNGVGSRGAPGDVAKKKKKKKRKQQGPPPQAGGPVQAGPTTGAPTTADATNALFTTATTCALCHTTAPRSSALLTADGEDVSPDHTWRGTMMANSFRDPYWQAKVEHELSAAPASEAADIQAFCLGCHSPMAATSAGMLDTAMPTVAAAASDPLAVDGVSCTLCHQIREDGLGEDESFTAGFVIGAGKTAYGPYARPFTRPMLRHSGYQAVHSDHVSESSVCGSCHTFFTNPSAGSPGFLEQAPFLEWRNSVYTDENGTTATSKTCRDCHMADAGTMRIAHNPAGRDFGRTRPREHVRSHAIVGGNAFMLDILADNAEELAVRADEDQLDATQEATRAALREAATLVLSAPRRRAGNLELDVTVTNLTGHKLPSSYPSRRAWLRLQVVSGRRVVFDSGAYDEDGYLIGPEDDMLVPHADVITDDADVVIYEARPVDEDGEPTFLLRKMATYGKDTRLLPLGWSASGPDAEKTAPVGTNGDDDFRDGSDTVTYQIPLAGLGRSVTVHAWLLYQTVPPDWIEPLRDLETPHAKAFVEMYDAADKSPAVLASASIRE